MGVVKVTAPHWQLPFILTRGVFEYLGSELVTDFLKRVLLLMVGGGQKHDEEPKTCKEVGYCASMTQQISYTVREKITERS